MIERVLCRQVLMWIVVSSIFFHYSGTQTSLHLGRLHEIVIDELDFKEINVVEHHHWEVVSSIVHWKPIIIAIGRLFEGQIYHRFINGDLIGKYIHITLWQEKYNFVYVRTTTIGSSSILLLLDEL